MKILVTNHSLSSIGGSETFTFTFVEELCRRGYDVDVYSPKLGFVSKKIDDLTSATIVKYLNRDYDIIFSSHHNTLSKILKSEIKGYKIHTLHGTINELEKPVKGANSYVSVSKEVYNSLLSEGIKSTVIYNGINLDRYSNKKEINEKIKSICCICQGRIARSNIKYLCEKLDIEYISTYKLLNIWNIEDYINKADLVISLGRGAIESLACGRNVLVYDSRDYMESYCGGMINKHNINELKECNFSGRSKKEIVSSENQIVGYLNDYNPSLSSFFREYTKEHFDIRKQVDKYLNLVL